MIRGMNKFQEHFADFGDQYVLIGGAASDLVMEDAGATFRATKDLDIVLCLEALNQEFAEAFWEFINAGGYQNQQRSTGDKIFYRFDRPTDKNYPVMLELFSRTPDTLVLGDDSHLTPIPISEDVSSLSAILLDEDYYHFLHQHILEIDGVSVVDQECLIPLKARAWLDLNSRLEAGEKIDSRNIKKHKYDVFRLFQVLSPEQRLELPEAIASDMHRFLDALSQDTNLSLKPYGLNGLGVLDVVATLRRIYQLPNTEAS